MNQFKGKRISLSRLSLYRIVVHIMLLVFFLATILLGYENYKRELKEQYLVEQYAPRMQELCDFFGSEIQIKTYDDLLNAFEESARADGSSD